jgi:hypothetical protein
MVAHGGCTGSAKRYRPMENCLPEELFDGSGKIKGLLKDFKGNGLSAFKKMDEKDQRAVINWSKEVARQYTTLIDNDPSNIKDISDLPFPKEDIKLAIKIMLPVYLSIGPKSMIKRLKLAYQELASFQQIDKGDYNRIMSPEASKENDDSITKRENLNIYNKYLEITITKRKILFQEIENYVEDLKYAIKNEN